MRKISITFFTLACVCILSHEILTDIIPHQYLLDYYSPWNFFYMWEVYLSFGLLFLSLSKNK